MARVAACFSSSPGSRTSSPADHSTWDCRAACRMCWWAVPAPLKELCCHLSCSLSTSQTFRFNSSTCHLQKFSDDSSIVSCIKDDNEAEYRALVESFVRWCDTNHLQLNIEKTKELVVDYRRSKKKRPPTPNLDNLEAVAEERTPRKLDYFFF